MTLGPMGTLVYTKLAIREGDWRSLERAFPLEQPTPAMVSAFTRGRALYLARIASGALLEEPKP